MKPKGINNLRFWIYELRLHSLGVFKRKATELNQ